MHSYAKRLNFAVVEIINIQTMNLKLTYIGNDGIVETKTIPWSSEQAEAVMFPNRHPEGNPDMRLQVLLPSKLVDFILDFTDGNVECLSLRMDK